METSEWKPKFDEFILSRGASDSAYVQLNYDALVAFIQFLLDQQKAELLEKLILKNPFVGTSRLSKLPEEHKHEGYNQAVSDLEALKLSLTPPIEGKDENPPEPED